MKNHISVYIYHMVEQGCHQQPPPLCPDTIALANIPVPAVRSLYQSPPLHFPLPPQTHLARLSLWQMPSSIAPVTVILAGSSLCVGASHRGNHLLDYEPDVSALTHGNTKGRRISREKARERGNYALTSFPLSVLNFSHLLCPESTLRRNDMASPAPYSATEA